MPNFYFQFKQFTVYHDLCAMKVGVDGVTLGAWTNIDDVKSILDVGTGSGLIALMLTQRNCEAIIDAIDIEEIAVKQAKINFNNSPWKNRLSVFHLPLQEFASFYEKKYDLIVSNPPYFQNSLKSPEINRNKARHTDTLSHEELINHSISLLNAKGKLCIILPLNTSNQLIEYAESIGLYCLKKIFVYPNPRLEAKRLLLEFGFQKQPAVISKLIIETTERHVYTPEYSDLVKDFYLKL